MWFAFACSPTNSRETSTARQQSGEQSNLGETPNEEETGPEQPVVDKRFVPVEKVSRFSLDDEKFNVVRLAIGLQTFLESQSPVVTYKLPRDADYVEILRCKHDTILNAGATPVSLVDLELSGLSEFQKGQLYRSNDYFRAGEDSNSCELITDGHLGESFIDSFSPSGSYRYLVRACVTPKRLVDTEKLTKRNCSKRVAISSELVYTNERKAKEQKYLRLASAFASRIDATTSAMRALAEEGNRSLEECMERNRQRIIDKTIRDAWITMASAVIEVGFELYTVKATSKDGSLLKHYFGGRKTGKGQLSIGRNMDRMQLLGASQGVLLADTFIKLAGSSHDMPRSCAEHDRLLDEYFILETTLVDLGFEYHYYSIAADFARQGQEVAGGVQLHIPQVDFSQPRDFVDAYFEGYGEQAPPPPPESTDEDEEEGNEEDADDEDDESDESDESEA